MRIRHTTEEKAVLDLAESEARRLGSSFIGVEHLLLGILGYADGGAYRVLDDCGIEQAAYRREVMKIAGSGPRWDGEFLHWHPRLEKVFSDSRQEAQTLGHAAVRTEHLLLGVVRDDHIAGKAMRGLGVTSDELRQAALDSLRSAP